MTVKSKKAFLGLLLMGSMLAGYALWLLLRPVEIVAVHEDGNHSSVLVKSFPFTDKGKIAWWLKNKNALKKNIIFLSLNRMVLLLLFSGYLVKVIKKRENMTGDVLKI